MGTVIPQRSADFEIVKITKGHIPMGSGYPPALFAFRFVQCRKLPEAASAAGTDSKLAQTIPESPTEGRISGDIRRMREFRQNSHCSQ